MLLAYIDEIGEPGAYIERTHPRFNTSPAFGYAGFIVPEESARRFGSSFNEAKRRLFRSEISESEHPGRWERKGASIFRPDTWDKFPQQLRVFNGLVRQLRSCGGVLVLLRQRKAAGNTEADQSRRDGS